MLYHAPPAYRVIAATGPDHEKLFLTEIAVGGKILGIGEGRSKKQSEQEAAKKALHELQKAANRQWIEFRLNIPIGGVTDRSCPNSRQMY